MIEIDGNVCWKTLNMSMENTHTHTRHEQPSHAIEALDHVCYITAQLEVRVLFTWPESLTLKAKIS